ncbi:hypothetical protein J6590_101710 [Homalodisca vitripennis]|nr:hypothetical protein J6590_101710 [Homalodisca vitripennis]
MKPSKLLNFCSFKSQLHEKYSRIPSGCGDLDAKAMPIPPAPPSTSPMLYACPRTAPLKCNIAAVFAVSITSTAISAEDSARYRSIEGVAPVVTVSSVT